ncbi:ADP-ribosylglycohydrolase family protein [Paraburkholderia sp. UCT31]|nr:ADP-ribosylglycohydrolase family protein [Paraburkholderia sp. UCT31]
MESKIRGGLYGLLVGDACGVPYEFNQPSSLPPLNEIDMTPPATFGRSHQSAPPYAYSDDGAQALCLLATLNESPDTVSMDQAAFVRRMIMWSENGYLAVDGEVFDIGIQTSRAFDRILDGIPVERAASDDFRSNGNGSLMRVLPLALWHTGSDAELIRLAAEQSVPTHAHSLSKLACGFFCLVARRLLAHEPLDSAWQGALATLKELTLEQGENFDMFLTALSHQKPGGTGYVIDTLASAHEVLVKSSSYDETVRRAISMGHDTDTTAAVAGGLAGIIYGFEGIPARWFQLLAGKELAEPLVAALVQKRAR